MGKWEEKLPPILREKLAKIGEPSEEEKERARDLSELEELLARFFKDELKEEELFRKLKAFEERGKDFLLEEAKRRLEGSFKASKLRIRIEREEGRWKVLLGEEPLILELSDKEFEEAVRRYPLLVVDCWAPWCGPCRMIAPVIEELARAYRGKIAFAKLNVDENPITAMRYDVRSIPTLLVFKNGELVDRKVGFMPKEMLEPELIKHISS